jgi:hypothetical protein
VNWFALGIEMKNGETILETRRGRRSFFSIACTHASANKDNDKDIMHKINHTSESKAPTVRGKHLV